MKTGSADRRRLGQGGPVRRRGGSKETAGLEDPPFYYFSGLPSADVGVAGALTV
jgi:hypothetical protein